MLCEVQEAMPKPTAKVICVYICLVSIKSHTLRGSHGWILVGGLACLFDIHATNSIGLIDSAFVFIVLSVWNVVLILGSQGPKLETNIPKTGFPTFFSVHIWSLKKTTKSNISVISEIMLSLFIFFGPIIRKRKTCINHLDFDNHLDWEVEGVCHWVHAEIYSHEPLSLSARGATWEGSEHVSRRHTALNFVVVCLQANRNFCQQQTLIQPNNDSLTIFYET